MIGYVTLGTNDLDKATSFYDELLASIGWRRVLEEADHFVAWGQSMQTTSLSVTRPFDGKPATVGNGVMVAIALDSPEQVNALHARALELGGTDEGPPGFRSDTSVSGFYGGYFRDPDGNKLNAFCIVPG